MLGGGTVPNRPPPSRQQNTAHDSELLDEDEGSPKIPSLKLKFILIILLPLEKIVRAAWGSRRLDWLHRVLYMDPVNSYSVKTYCTGSCISIL
jgi:hypothetical protein